MPTGQLGVISNGPTTATPARESADGTRTWTFPISTGAHPLSAKVTEVGQGTPVIFLHGLVGLNDHWEGVVERLKSRCRCIMFEVPLLELTGEDCSVMGVTAITGRFLAEHIGKPAVLIGNSFGGHVALRLAHEQPDRVSALVLTGTSGLYERPMFSAAPVRPTRAWLADKIGELFFDQAKVWDSDIDRAYTELSKRGGVRAMVRLSKSAKRDHMGDRLAHIKAPTLLVWGRNDIVTTPDSAEEFCRLLPNAELQWLDRCGHAPMMEWPEPFAEAALAFFAQRKLI